MNSRRRRVVFGLGWALTSMLLFVLFAQPDPGVPWKPAQVVATDPQQFESSASTLDVGDSSLSVTGADASGVAFALAPTDPFDATELPRVRYGVDVVPVASRPLLLWRSEGQLHSMVLPMFAGGGVVRPDPARGWRGTIEALGIAAAPIDVLPAEAVSGQRFTLHQLQAESESWSGALRSLSTAWLAYRPWSGRSINTGGFEFGAEAGASMPLWVALWCASGVLLAGLVLDRRSRTRWGMRIVLLGVAVLALQQVVLLTQRTRVVAAAAGLADARQQMLSAQPALAAASIRLLDALGPDPVRERIMVLGDDRFGREYVTWLLRQHDVATIEAAGAIGPNLSRARGIVVLVGMDATVFDPDASHLTLGTGHLQALELIAAGPLRAYRIGDRRAAP